MLMERLSLYAKKLRIKRSLSFLEEIKIAKDIAVNNIVNSVYIRSDVDVYLVGLLNA